jgi:hypothetical protein
MHLFVEFDKILHSFVFAKICENIQGLVFSNEINQTALTKSKDYVQKGPKLCADFYRGKTCTCRTDLQYCIVITYHL